MSDLNRRILLVDDTEAIHHDFLTILRPAIEPLRLNEAKLAMLGEAGEPRNDRVQFEVDSAMQGEQALSMVRQRVDEGHPYALVFVDILMPTGWDGVETLQRIWEFDPYVQAVVCSAHADHDWEEIADQLGSDDQLLFLRKPFDNCEIRQLARALTQKWSRDAAARGTITEMKTTLVGGPA